MALPHRALVLFGRVGTFTHSATYMPGGAHSSGDARMLALCAVSIQRHVLTPWRAAGSVDVFIHSWNPELSTTMEELYSPRRSRHDSQVNSTMRCPGRPPYPYACMRTMWALRGAQRALRLRSEYAAQHRQHAAVMLLRHDIHWLQDFTPLHVNAGVRLWLPMDCDVNGTVRDEKLVHERRSATLRLSAKVKSRGVHKCPSQLCNTYLEPDWWFVADAALADGFAGVFDRVGEYMKIAKSMNFSIATPHVYWGLFFYHVMKLREQCQVGFAHVVYLDFEMGRNAGERYPRASVVRTNDHNESVWRDFLQQEKRQPRCSFEGAWRPHFNPHDYAATACDASREDYKYACPAAPAQPVRWSCRAGKADFRK